MSQRRRPLFFWMRPLAIWRQGSYQNSHVWLKDQRREARRRRHLILRFVIVSQSSFNHSPARGSWHTQPLWLQRLQSVASVTDGFISQLCSSTAEAVTANISRLTWPFSCENVHHSAGDFFPPLPLLVFHCAHCWHSLPVLHVKPLTFGFMSPLRCCAASALYLAAKKETHP